jgi:AcrR family transcriptional regulator
MGMHPTGGRRGPADPPPDRLRPLILAATERLIIGGGEEAVTLEAVAAAAGVAKGEIKRRFSSPRDLVTDAFAATRATWIARLTAHASGPDGDLRGMVTSTLASFYALAERDRGVYKLLTRPGMHLKAATAALVPSLEEGLAEALLPRFRPALESAGVECTSRIGARLLARSVVRLAEESLEQWSEGRAVPKERALQLTAAMIERMLTSGGSRIG